MILLIWMMFATVLQQTLLAPLSGVAADQALDEVRSARVPVRDQARLRTRVLPQPTTSTPAQLAADELWVNDVVQHTYDAVPVDLVYSSAHADWYVQRGRSVPNVAATAAYFESRTLPVVWDLVGVDWQPGVDGRPRLAVFHGQTAGVAGYMSSVDLLPRSLAPYSNERPIVYLSDSLRPGTRGYDETLAHELEHLAHALVNPYQEGWLDEGLAELVSKLVTGSGAGSLDRFKANPDVQLTAWSEKPWQARAHYQASYLLSHYLMERGGGQVALRDLVQSGGQGVETLERYARARGIASSFEELFRDWLIANLLDRSDVEDGRFGHRDIDFQAALSGVLQPGGPATSTSVSQFAADYYELAGGAPAELSVEVSPTVNLVNAPGADGAIFWSLRGDSTNSRLTRRFDLRGLSQATLAFRLWHDLEPDYDFCYVMGSSDGQSWQALRGQWTTDRDLVGNALGPGYTGPGGAWPGWVDEQVDLAPLSGGEAWVRFECATDQGYSASGLAVDDVRVPELGFHDDAEIDRGWLAEGFVRAAHAMTQPALVTVVEVAAGHVALRDVPIGADGRGQVRIDAHQGPNAQRFLIVAGLAPRTLQPMSYTVQLRTAGW